MVYKLIARNRERFSTSLEAAILCSVIPTILLVIPILLFVIPALLPVIPAKAGIQTFPLVRAKSRTKPSNCEGSVPHAR